MSVKNVLNCKPKNSNTGFGACVVDIGFITGFIWAPDNYKIPAEVSIAAAITNIQNGIIADVYANRLFPVPGIVAPTDSTETLPVVTYPDGSKAVVRDIFYDWTFQNGQGKYCLGTRLRALINGNNKSFYFYDKFGRLYGTDTGDGMITSIKPNLSWANAFKLNTGAAPTEYSFQINFEATLINDSIAFLDFTNNGGYAFLKTLSGLQDVDISKVLRAANVLTVSAVTDCGSSNLGTLYGVTLAVPGAWAAYNDINGTPGNVIAITGVTYSAANNNYAITVDTTDPNYSAGAPIWVGLAGPTETYPILMTGYEGLPVSITV
jgi:hypothetical protein